MKRNDVDRTGNAGSARESSPWERSRRDPARYDDMMELSPPELPGHPRMPMRDRAAQFAPFAALTGFEEVIREAAAESEKENE